MTAFGAGRLPAVLDGLREGVVVLDAGRVTGLNRAAAAMLRVQPERALGRPAIEVLRHYRLEAVALGGGEAELEVGGRVLVARGVPGGLVLEDVTDARRRDAEVREVTAVLSHEFRTPVAAIKGLLEALALDPPPDGRARFVEIASQEADRLVRLVEDLTVGFRPLAERTFEFGDAAERVVALVAADVARRGVRLRVSGERVLVRCDPDKLVQVLLNLVENAARHGPNPGELRLSAEAAGSEVTVSLLDEGGRLEAYEVLFEARRRGAGGAPGTGMGLFIVRNIVSSWRGRVWARFRPDAFDGAGGNEFGFTVPGGAGR